MRSLRVAGIALTVLLSVTLRGEFVYGSPRVIEARPLETFPRERIAIETRSARRYVFDAWRADTYETRAQGLMFVEHLAPEQAMVFVYDPPQRVSMYMRNTYISLDMLFADGAGCIVNIAANTTPLSLESIVGVKPVAYVVEVVAGTAAARGINVGDRIVRFEAQPNSERALQTCTG